MTFISLVPGLNQWKELSADNILIPGGWLDFHSLKCLSWFRIICTKIWQCSCSVGKAGKDMAFKQRMAFKEASEITVETLIHERPA